MSKNERPEKSSPCAQPGCPFSVRPSEAKRSKQAVGAVFCYGHRRAAEKELAKQLAIRPGA